MRLIIKQNKLQACLWAAHHIADKINAFKPTKNKPFVLGLPTGSTPLETYAELIKLNKAGIVSFENVVTFNMDEYLGLPATHEQSYHYFMRHNFFDHINIKKENIHILDGMAKDPQKECENYEKAILEAGGIHLFLGGVGEDGHIAFNEPFTSLCSRTHIQPLTQDTIRVNSRFFDFDTSKVPTKALTVGVQTIMDAEEVLILAFGKNKATALYHGIEGALSHVWTISAVQTHNNAIIACDIEATEKLSKETTNYFLDIEK
ncbi:MAG TPA: glucosamine-6-phosphate deaminase [Alphaproteobacteria bacterium]|nr:glucosamine-6-phosphate deaminase [Alphaproteobacteria bacterium]